MMIWAFIQFEIRFEDQKFYITTISILKDELFQEIRQFFTSGGRTSNLLDNIQSEHQDAFTFRGLSQLRIIPESELKILQTYYPMKKGEYNSLIGCNLFNLMDEYLIKCKIDNFLYQELLEIPNKIWNNYSDATYDLYTRKDIEKSKKLYQYLLDWKNSLDYKGKILENLPEDLKNNNTYDAEALSIIEEYSLCNYYIEIDVNTVPVKFLNQHLLQKPTDKIFFFFAKNYLYMNEVGIKDLQHSVFDDVIKYVKVMNPQNIYVL